MKRVLLIAVNAKYIHSNPAVYSLKAYAQAALEDLNVEIDIAEYTINQNTENILADIYRHRPDIAAFSCYIWNWNTIQELLPELPKLLPDTKLWLCREDSCTVYATDGNHGRRGRRDFHTACTFLSCTEGTIAGYTRTGAATGTHTAKRAD